ncbi:hypothetical protein Hanom_Chr06g00497171 [Helianthus anomalus]
MLWGERRCKVERMKMTGTVEMVAGQFTGKEAAPEKLAGALAGDRRRTEKITCKKKKKKKTFCLFVCLFFF